MRWVAILLACAPGAVVTYAATFSRDIAPILQAKCLSCHNAEKAKGGFRLHTFAALRKPGKSKELPVVAGKPEESELFKRLTTADEDDRMPQKDEPLAPAQIELFRAWIASGAELDRGQPESLLSALLPPRHAMPPAAYPRPLPILALTFAPGGKQVAVSGHYEVTLWSLNGVLDRRLTNLPQRVRSLAFDPGGQALVVAGGSPGRSGELCVIDFASNLVETNLLQTSDEVLAVAFSASGKLLACAGTDNAIHLFDWKTRQPLQTIQQHADWVTSVAFSTNGDEIASASRDRTARLYETVTGNLMTAYTVQNAPLSVVAFLPDGQLVSGGRDKSLHIWEPKEGRKKGEIGSGSETCSLVCAGEFLFTAGTDGAVRQYGTVDRKLIRTLQSAGETVYALAYEPESKKLASGSYDGSVHVWNAETGSLESSFVAAPGWTAER